MRIWDLCREAGYIHELCGLMEVGLAGSVSCVGVLRDSDTRNVIQIGTYIGT
jgi:hypothetical protein